MKQRKIIKIASLVWAALVSCFYAENEIPVVIEYNSKNMWSKRIADELMDFRNSHTNLYKPEEGANHIVLKIQADETSAGDAHASVGCILVGFRCPGTSGNSMTIAFQNYVVGGLGSGGYSPGSIARTEALKGSVRFLNRGLDQQTLTFLAVLFDHWNQSTWASFRAAAKEANSVVEALIADGKITRTHPKEDFEPYSAE